MKQDNNKSNRYKFMLLALSVILLSLSYIAVQDQLDNLSELIKLQQYQIELINYQLEEAANA